MDDVLTLAEAADSLGVSADALRTQVHSRRLQARLIGNTYIVTRTELDRYRRVSLGRRGRPFLHRSLETGWAFSYRFDEKVPSERIQEAHDVVRTVFSEHAAGAAILVALTTELVRRKFHLADIAFESHSHFMRASIGECRSPAA